MSCCLMDTEVWKSLPRDYCVLSWQGTVGLGNELSPGDVGKTAVSAELQAKEPGQCCLL